jgi:hypothetical protein
MSSSAEIHRRLTLLKAEVALDFPELLQELENGLQIVLVTDRVLGKDLNPDELRRIGGMAMLCNHYYDAAVLFMNENRIAELNSKIPPKA